MPENNRFTNTNFAEIFGGLKKVHRVRRGCFETFGIPAIVFGCLLFSVLMYFTSDDSLVIPVCVLPFLLMSGGIVWHLFRTSRDELRIYENGFTYRSGKRLQACLWKDIKFCHRREQNAREISETGAETFPLGAVETKTGEMIEFDHDLDGTTEIAALLKKHK